MRETERLLSQLCDKCAEGRIEAKLKVVDGEVVDFNEIVKRREILEDTDISQFSDSLAHQ